MKVLALDLEGTLISNAMSQIARPGLFEFLENCRKIFPRIVLFTCVSEERFRPIASLLVEEGSAPAWFAAIEYITWSGETKDLNFVEDAAPDEILLVDDLETYVHKGQEGQWINIEYYASPYAETDTGLRDVFRLLQERV